MQIAKIRVALYYLPHHQILVVGDAFVRNFMLVNILHRLSFCRLQ